TRRAPASRRSRSPRHRDPPRRRSRRSPARALSLRGARARLQGLTNRSEGTATRSHGMVVQDDRDELAEIFERSEARAFGGDSLRITDDGIWMPTPWPVVRSLVAALPGSGVLGAAAVPTI